MGDDSSWFDDPDKKVQNETKRARDALKAGWDSEIKANISALVKNAKSVAKAKEAYQKRRAKLETQKEENKKNLVETLTPLHAAAKEAHDKLMAHFIKAREIRKSAKQNGAKNAQGLDKLKRAFRENNGAYAVLWKNGNIKIEKGTYHITNNKLSGPALEFYKSHAPKAFNDQVDALVNVNFEHSDDDSGEVDDTQINDDSDEPDSDDDISESDETDSDEDTSESDETDSDEDTSDFDNGGGGEDEAGADEERPMHHAPSALATRRREKPSGAERNTARGFNARPEGRKDRRRMDHLDMLDRRRQQRKDDEEQRRLQQFKYEQRRQQKMQDTTTDKELAELINAFSDMGK